MASAIQEDRLGSHRQAGLSERRQRAILTTGAVTPVAHRELDRQIVTIASGAIQ
jgi:hypothetical protein